MSTEKYFTEDGEISLDEIFKIDKPIYITGHCRAAIIIENLWGKVPIYICSPALWKTASLSAALRQMRRLRLPPLYGGFRPVTMSDVLLLRYQCDLEFHRRQNIPLKEVAVPAELIDWAEGQNLILELKFFEHVQPSELIKVMAYIVDPRWFCNKGLRIANLEAYFGLTPRRRKDRWEHARFQLLTECWKDHEFIDFIKHVNVDVRTAINQPKYAIYQRWYRAYNGPGMGFNDTYADIKANQLLLSLLFYLWLERLEPNIKFHGTSLLPEETAHEFELWRSKFRS